ncbi:MAG: hypothetical protein WDN26_06500 [Chitinophagaceae bacterium]
MQLKRLLLLLPVFFTIFCFTASAQAFDNAGAYMDYITKANDELTQKYLFYLSGVSHGKNARKVEKRRLDVVQAINDTRYTVMGMPPYKGDRTLKDTTIVYLKMLNSVFNEDYGKIVNMEDIAEQSYDLMEAYMLAKEKANEKLDEASKRQYEMQLKFAAKNNITIVNNQTELESKMKTAATVMEHYNKVYLIFFKCYKQEAYLIEAGNKQNIISVEQNINSLQKFADEGLEKLKDMKGYNNDATLIAACKNLLIFYKSEAEKSGAASDYFLKEENFAKFKKQFESKPSSKRTQQDVDQFNNAVNEINAAGNNYNKANAGMNKERTALTNDWERAVKRYMDDYMPKQQKN